MHMHDKTITSKAPTVRCAEACAFFNVRRLSRLLERHYSRALASAGVTASQFAILIAVAATRERSVSALGRTLGMSQSALSRQLAWMARRGWVEISAGEGRAQRVRLASSGDARVRQALPRWQRAQDEVIASLGEQPWQRLLGGVRRLAAQ
jgi:DNA-binding MarR family transcriptional regulator